MKSKAMRTMPAQFKRAGAEASSFLSLRPFSFIYCSFAALFGGNRYFSAEKMQKGGKNT
jgi:hypothetical protein